VTVKRFGGQWWYWYAFFCYLLFLFWVYSLFLFTQEMTKTTKLSQEKRNRLQLALHEFKKRRESLPNTAKTRPGLLKSISEEYTVNRSTLARAIKRVCLASCWCPNPSTHYCRELGEHAIEEDIGILFFPHNMTTRLQPLDRGIFGKHKKLYRIGRSNIQTCLNNNGVVLDVNVCYPVVPTSIAVKEHVFTAHSCFWNGIFAADTRDCK
jgi:hypothetical protein